MGLGKMLKKLGSEKIAMISLFFLMTLVVVALFASYIVPFDPLKQDLMNVMEAPSLKNWLGTDELGRDTFSRLLMGSRAAIQAGLIAMIIPLFIGVPMGIISGYQGGIVDDIFMRIVDGILSIPAILLALGITVL